MSILGLSDFDTMIFELVSSSSPCTSRPPAKVAGIKHERKYIFIVRIRVEREQDITVTDQRIIAQKNQ